jgi:diguanylate cyclase (GGDEF)-like protein
MSSDPGHQTQWTPPEFRWGDALRSFTDWLVSSPQAQAPDIQRRLLYQSLTKSPTLIVSIMSSSLMAGIAVYVTAAPWAYMWLLAELVIGCIRISVMSAFVKTETSGEDADNLVPIWAGLTSFIVMSAGASWCAISGEWPLILMSGMGLAIMIGAVSSRNAGTPRYGFLLICVLTVPFSVATLASPIPNLFLTAIQLPLYACGLIFVMFHNYKVLLNLHHSERENHRLAHDDQLTGLPNRFMNLKRFDELLAALASVSDKTQNGFTVFCLDLDGFKDVNDRFGHAAGDAVLVTLADRLRNSVRVQDFVSRIGGDEFIILLPAISESGAAMIAERIIACVEMPFDVGRDAPVRIGISIGSASAPQDGETADSLMRSADQAMYEAKRLGKGLFVAGGTRAAEATELAPQADADARIAQTGLEPAATRRRHFPLPLHSKSL